MTFSLLPTTKPAPTDDDGWEPYFGKKSEAALVRETIAVVRFDQLRSQPPPTTATVTQLLEPSCHLTCASWSTFSKYVRSFPGWNAKRREATEEDKSALNETRKGRVYFVDVVFDPAKANKTDSSSKATTKRPTDMDVPPPLGKKKAKLAILHDSSNFPEGDTASQESI